MRRTGGALGVFAFVFLVAGAFAKGQAQPIPPVFQPTPSPTRAPAPTPPTPRPTPLATPEAPGERTPTPEPEPQATPPDDPYKLVGLPTPTPVPPLPVATTGPGTSTRTGVTAPGIPPGFKIPVFPRTPGHNTTKLVQTLERVRQVGIPLDQALLEGMGQFPVAGVAWYSDDWMAPRFTPFFHLHEGLDIFADFGTPIRSPGKGTVSRLVNGPIGGLAVWVTGTDGTQYYFAHMQSYANGVAEGLRVETGTVLGFVGDSGNAKGGAPHLHFEIHKRGAPIPPKPSVDKWLADAQRDADGWVASRILDVLSQRQLLRTEHALAGLLATDTTTPQPTPEYSLLLTLLDPVGGPLGLLSRLPIVPSSAESGSTRLLDELIRQRVDGSLLTTFVTGSEPARDAG